MFKLDKQVVLNDIKDFKSKGYLTKLDKIYRKFPVTKCNSCGTCCNDSPKVSYPEFLYVYNYFLNELSLNKEELINAYKNAIREYFYGLISNDKKCPFLDINNKCIVHKVAPISCKRWGLQKEEDNNYDWEKDLEYNKTLQKLFIQKGINIPDELVNKKTLFCNNVKIIKNPYNFIDKDFEKIVKDIQPLIIYYRDKNNPNFSLGSYLVYLLIGENMIEDRIKIIKDYQNGNSNAVEEYINKIDFDRVI